MAPSAKPSNDTVAPDGLMIDEARSLGLDIAHASATEIAQAIKAEKERRWKIENAEAIQADNDYVAKHGLPLAKYRMW